MSDSLALSRLKRKRVEPVPRVVDARRGVSPPFPQRELSTNRDHLKKQSPDLRRFRPVRPVRVGARQPPAWPTRPPCGFEPFRRQLARQSFKDAVFFRRDRRRLVRQFRQCRNYLGNVQLFRSLTLRAFLSQSNASRFTARVRLSANGPRLHVLKERAKSANSTPILDGVDFGACPR